MKRREFLKAATIASGVAVVSPIAHASETKAMPVLTYKKYLKPTTYMQESEYDYILCERLFAEGNPEYERYDYDNLVVFRYRVDVWLPQEYQTAFSGTPEDEKYAWWGKTTLVKDIMVKKDCDRVPHHPNPKPTVGYYICRSNESTRGDLLPHNDA